MASGIDSSPKFTLLNQFSEPKVHSRQQIRVELSFLMVYLNAIKVQNSVHMYLSQELQLGEFSVGLSQQAGSSGLNNLGVSFGLSAENFDFGASYNFNFEMMVWLKDRNCPKDASVFNNITNFQGKIDSKLCVT